MPVSKIIHIEHKSDLDRYIQNNINPNNIIGHRGDIALYLIKIRGQGKRINLIHTRDFRFYSNYDSKKGKVSEVREIPPDTAKKILWDFRKLIIN
jgi:hypothetical protein